MVNAKTGFLVHGMWPHSTIRSGGLETWGSTYLVFNWYHFLTSYFGKIQSKYKISHPDERVLNVLEIAIIKQ